MEKNINELREAAQTTNEIAICICSVDKQVHSFVQSGGQTPEQIVAAVCGSMGVNPDLEFTLINAVVNFCAADPKRRDTLMQCFQLAATVHNTIR